MSIQLRIKRWRRNWHFVMRLNLFHMLQLRSSEVSRCLKIILKCTPAPGGPWLVSNTGGFLIHGPLFSSSSSFMILQVSMISSQANQDCTPSKGGACLWPPQVRLTEVASGSVLTRLRTALSLKRIIHHCVHRGLLFMKLNG